MSSPDRHTDTTPAVAGAANNPLSTRMPRIDELTGLRWWAAFFVFAHHMGWAPLPPVVNIFLHYGYLGVTFFFVLSGFVLMWAATPDMRVSTFFWRRFARVYPSHVVAFVLAIPVFYTLAVIPEGSWLKPVDIVALLLALFLLQAWFLDPEIFFAGNPPSWSLSYEAFFYAAFPLVAKLLTPTRKRGALIFAAGIVVGIFAYRIFAKLFPETALAQLPSPIQHLTEFALGMALAWAIRCGWRPRIPVWLTLGALAGLIVAIALAARYGPLTSVGLLLSNFTNEFVTAGCALAIVAVASRSLRGDRSLLAWKPFVRLGEWSFAFYLIHLIVIYIAQAIVGEQPASWNNLLWQVVLLTVSIAAAAALHLLVEKPFERRLRGWKDRRDARVLAARTAADPLL